MHGNLKLANLMVVGIMEKTLKREKKGMGMGVGVGGGKYSSEERNGTGKCGSHDEVFFLFFFFFFFLFFDSSELGRSSRGFSGGAWMCLCLCLWDGMGI